MVICSVKPAQRPQLASGRRALAVASTHRACAIMPRLFRFERRNDAPGDHF
jgi:hypothetical protein